MLFFRVTPTGGNGDGDNYLDITGTLAAGETEITLTDSHIETDGIYDFYTSKYGVVPTDVEIAAGSVTLTFDAQSENITVMVRKWGESGGGDSSSWDYSTTETDTGQKWIDGKTIYCKVLDFSDSPVALPSNNQRDFPNAMETNERIVDGHVIYGSDIFKGMCPAFMTTDNQGTLGVNSFHAVNAYQIIVKYIKL